MAYTTTLAQAKALEGIVARLEKAIGRDCVVARNQKLRNLLTSIRREFDVVVRAKLPHREFVAVVEVQKRNRRVGFPTLEGWIAKAHGVGVNRLIAVSEKGYTETAKDLARNQGDFVDLYEIVPHDGWPSDLPRIQMQVGMATWKMDQMRVNAKFDSKVSGGKHKPGDVVSGQAPLASRSLVMLPNNIVMSPRELLNLISIGLSPFQSQLLGDGTTIDVDIPVLKDQRFELVVPEATGEVESLGIRSHVTIEQVAPDAWEYLQYKNVLDGKVAGYVVTPIVNSGSRNPTRIDLAIAPPTDSDATSVVLPGPEKVPPSMSIGNQFSFLVALPIGPPLRATATISRDDARPVDGVPTA